MIFDLRFDDDEVAAWLRRISRSARDMSPAMREIAFLGENQTRERFATETEPDGTPWKPSIRKLEEGGKTLTKEGHLAGSISSRVTANSAEWGTNRPYDAIHQFGGTITPKDPGGYLFFHTPNGGTARVKSVTIPARKYLPSDLSELDADAVQEILIRNIFNSTVVLNM